MQLTEFQRIDRAGIRSALGDARSFLILSDESQPAEEVCSGLLNWTAPEDGSVLSITLDDSPDDRLEQWETVLGTLPSEIVVLAVGEVTRSATETTASGRSANEVSVDTVADPSDLTGIAMAIGQYVEDNAGEDGTPMVCFHSITSLLLHADETRVFRFLHATIGRLRHIGARSHFHLDPVAHDESTINLFSSLVDATVSVDADGTVTVKVR